MFCFFCKKVSYPSHLDTLLVESENWTCIAYFISCALSPDWIFQGIRIKKHFLWHEHVRSDWMRNDLRWKRQKLVQEVIFWKVGGLRVNTKSNTFIQKHMMRLEMSCSVLKFSSRFDVFTPLMPTFSFNSQVKNAIQVFFLVIKCMKKGERSSIRLTRYFKLATIFWCY